MKRRSLDNYNYSHDYKRLFRLQAGEFCSSGFSALQVLQSRGAGGQDVSQHKPLSSVPVAPTSPAVVSVSSSLPGAAMPLHRAKLIIIFISSINHFQHVGVSSLEQVKGSYQCYFTFSSTAVIASVCQKYWLQNCAEYSSAASIKVKANSSLFTPFMMKKKRNSHVKMQISGDI